MKKVLFVTNHLQYSDGVAKALLNLVNNLDAEKYEISVCSLFTTDKNFISNFNNNIKIFSVFNRYFRGMHKLLKLVPKKLILNKVLKEKYDLVVAYQFGYPTELLSSEHVKLPKIAFMHGYDTSAIKLHKNYNKIVCVAKSSSEDYKRVVNFQERVTYCHNVFEFDDIVEKSKESIDVQDEFKLMKRPILAFVGRLSEEKGVERTLRAIAQLKGEGLCCSLAIVGDGSLKQQIESEINRLNLQEDIKMLGFQRNPYKFLAHCDAYVCNSYVEGLSTSCIEASVLGLDVISTEVSGAKEIVLDPEIGIVCENTDEAILNSLRTYIKDCYPTNKWKYNKEKAKQKWLKENVVKKFDTIIDEVLK